MEGYYSLITLYGKDEAREDDWAKCSYESRGLAKNRKAGADRAFISIRDCSGCGAGISELLTYATKLSRQRSGVHSLPDERSADLPVLRSLWGLDALSLSREAGRSSEVLRSGKPHPAQWLPKR
jgi:hypothetical protein